MRVQKILAISCIILCSASAFFPCANSHTETVASDQELYLLRVEHYLVVNATEDTGVFHIRYSFPPDYEYQCPIFLKVFNDTTNLLLHYQIENDTLPPNKLVNFTIGPMTKGESAQLHFTAWVLVKNKEFSDLPAYVKFPKRYQLPDETKTWLVATAQVQLHSILIHAKGRELRGLSSNLIRYAHRMGPFLRFHRFGLFVIGLNTGLLLSQDARTTLLIGGENVGRAHLACALFRQYDVPARVLLVNNDQGFWTQMHYMAEYYCPGYGWVLVETTFGKSPYETKHQVINRICYPPDEEDTKNDYIFRFMKGEERWFWIDNADVTPYYSDLVSGSKSQMFTENYVVTDQLTEDYAFVLTQLAFRFYQKYLGASLSPENTGFFDNATSFQQQAIAALKTGDLTGYCSSLNDALDEYGKITP